MPIEYEVEFGFNTVNLAREEAYEAGYDDPIESIAQRAKAAQEMYPHSTRLAMDWNDGSATACWDAGLNPEQP